MQTKTLNEIMEFDHVIKILGGKVVEANREIYGPDLYWDMDEFVLDTQGGWELLSGYSGQFQYDGPIMHPSEYIGGHMEQDILAKDGLYVALVCDTIYLNEDDETENVGWAVAYRPLG